MDQYQSDHTIHRKQLPNRKRNPAKRLSPTFEASTRKNTKKVVNLKRDSLRPEKLPNGKDFQCCLCSSTTFNLTKRPYKNRERAIEESSCYCYSCILSNKAKPTKAKLSSKVEDLEAIKKRKEEYIKSCNEFVQTLYESMKNEYVKKLCCPYFQKKACDCIQKYIVTGDESKVETRINDLCNLMKEAESLSKEKCYEIPADHEMRITGLSQSVILKFKRQLRDQSRSKLSRAKSDVDRMTVEDVNNTLKMVDDEKRKILRFEDKLRKRLEDIESSTSYQDPST
ncbi:DgyrCDS7540 [Dimorphilus gyrociliatus]|uniref:DgyrCDS7540 n=1 Tax=Dimorphilus gyrociliatus TaxID=2664684 RepID=A0A7I8VT12_9ANNE|nr:DgyrCDS7540 [Dimorphilus gyrociliatus]